MSRLPYKPLLTYRPSHRRLRVRWIGTYSPAERKYRLFKVIRNKGTPGLPPGYSSSTSVSITPERLFGWKRTGSEWRLTVLGLSVHYRKSTSGVFV